MNYDAHISKISHDGSGTIITAIEFERCPLSGPCHLCADGIEKIPVTIFANLDASEARRGERPRERPFAWGEVPRRERRDPTGGNRGL